MAEALEKIGWTLSNEAERAFRSVAIEDWKDVETLGEAAIEPLTIALLGEDFHIRYAAVQLLAKIHDPRVVEVLDAAIKQGLPDAIFKLAVMPSLGRKILFYRFHRGIHLEERGANGLIANG